jgi:hypothetical protein
MAGANARRSIKKGSCIVAAAACLTAVIRVIELIVAIRLE